MRQRLQCGFKTDSKKASTGEGILGVVHGRICAYWSRVPMLAAAAILLCWTKERLEPDELAASRVGGKEVRKANRPNGIEKKGKVEKRSVLMIA